MEELPNKISRSAPYCIVHDRSKCVIVKWKYSCPDIIAYQCVDSGIIWHRQN
ncbi:MAG: hypothetical protein ACMUHM_09065 [Thermoplasmatota archaeon]